MDRYNLYTVHCLFNPIRYRPWVWSAWNLDRIKEAPNAQRVPRAFSDYVYIGSPPPQHYNHRNYCHRLGQYGRLSLPENNRITNNLIWLTTIKNKYSLRKSENTLYRFYTISLYTKRMFTSDERSEFRILFETIFRIKSSVN